MKLRDIHILGISGVAIAAGLIGYLLGRKHGYELAEKDIFEEEYEEQKEDHLVETVVWEKSVLEDPNPHEAYVAWVPESIKKMQTENIGTELSWWQDYVLDDYHKKLKDYFAKEEDEDIENLRTQGDVEYTSEEPYLVTENDVFSDFGVDDIVQLTYYETDDVLVDSVGEILEERSVVVCEEFKKNFGYGSNDPNVVYVRNPKTKRDYEIVRDPGAYEQEVLDASDEQAINAVKSFKFGEEE